MKNFKRSDALIAVFMGAEPESCLTYHSDWYLLIPVIEKIKTLESSITILLEFNTYNIFKIVSYRYYNDVTFGDCSMLYIAYKGVVKFIKWYNENKKEND